MKLPLNLGGWIFFRGPGVCTFWGGGGGGWGLEPASGVGIPSMLTMIITIIINNTFELLILRHYFISNLLKSELKPDFTQHQKVSKNIYLTG